MLRRALVALALLASVTVLPMPVGASQDCTVLTHNGVTLTPICRPPTIDRSRWPLSPQASEPAPPTGGAASAPAAPSDSGQLLDRNGDGRINCPDFPTWNDAEAVYRSNPGDSYGLDGPPGPATEGVPGVPCEDLPGAPV